MRTRVQKWSNKFGLRMARRCFVVLISHVLLALSFPLGAVERIDSEKAAVDTESKLLWYDIRLLKVEGRGWTETESFFDRLPAKAKEIVREPVWNLSRHSAGMCARFTTSATAIHARWTLISDRLAMPHMPATGVSGLDLYVRHEGRWRWLGVGFPDKQTNRVPLTSGLPPGEREFLLYLPLYNGVSTVEIGLPMEAALSRAAPYPDGRKPILFYGTSIAQGGCASRPGMVHTAILGRRLNYPVINLGFSGNGRMEPEMSRLFAELDPSVYVLDCLPNMNAAMVTERVEPFVTTLRGAHPTTPILLVEDRSYTDAFLVTSKQQSNANNRAALRAAYNRLMEAGTPELHYLPGERLLNEDGEGTVDSSHPTDLGFVQHADAMEAPLRALLKQAR